MKKEIKAGLTDLFKNLEINVIPVEEALHIPVVNFVTDLLKVIDEVKSPVDLINIWHISNSIATKIFEVIDEILRVNTEEYTLEIESEEEDADLDDLASSTYMSESSTEDSDDTECDMTDSS